MKISIDKEILQKVLNYLATKPFQDVSELINEVLKNARTIEDETEKESTKKK